MKIYGIVGYKNSGKTGLVERLVAHFVQRGLRVSTLKHAHHDTEIDHEGRDSYRHRQAGAAQVLVSSPVRWALMTELRGDPEPPLETLLARLNPVDLVLIEGYKAAPHPKVEAHRAATGHRLLASVDPTIRAVAADHPLNISQPVFDLNDTASIAAFILSEVGL